VPRKKIYTVIWEDAVSISNIDIDELKKRPPELVETYGLVTKTKRYIIVMTHDSHGECNDYVRIPRALVKEMK